MSSAASLRFWSVRPRTTTTCCGGSRSSASCSDGLSAKLWAFPNPRRRTSAPKGGRGPKSVVASCVRVLWWRPARVCVERRRGVPCCANRHLGERLLLPTRPPAGGGQECLLRVEPRGLAVPRWPQSAQPRRWRRSDEGPESTPSGPPARVSSVRFYPVVQIIRLIPGSESDSRPVTDLQHRGSTAAHLSGRPARRRPST